MAQMPTCIMILLSLTVCKSADQMSNINRIIRQFIISERTEPLTAREKREEYTNSDLRDAQFNSEWKKTKQKLIARLEKEKSTGVRSHYRLTYGDIMTLSDDKTPIFSHQDQRKRAMWYLTLEHGNKTPVNFEFVDYDADSKVPWSVKVFYRKVAGYHFSKEGEPVLIAWEHGGFTEIKIWDFEMQLLLGLRCDLNLGEIKVPSLDYTMNTANGEKKIASSLERRTEKDIIDSLVKPPENESTTRWVDLWIPRFHHEAFWQQVQKYIVLENKKTKN